MRILVMALVIGCGSEVAAPSVVANPLDVSGPNRWAQRSFTQRHENMTFTLLPVLARAFHARRDTPYPQLACVTCHGADAEANDYRMPAALPPLDPDALPQTDEARWMAEFVTPTADRLMRAGGTTTCFTCHPSAP